MYIHEESDLVYLANPRTGSRATAKLLQNIGFEMRGSHHSGIPAREDNPRSPVRYIAFTTIRDPDDTLRSWAYKMGEAPPWNENARRRTLDLMPAQRAIIAGWGDGLFPHSARADRLLRFEHLGRDLAAFLDCYGLDIVKMLIDRMMS